MSIVAVSKKDGRVRICGNYKVTVNPALEIDQYPLPHSEDLYATLAGGQRVTTLDQMHAYISAADFGRRVMQVCNDQ